MYSSQALAKNHSTIKRVKSYGKMAVLAGLFLSLCQCGDEGLEGSVNVVLSSENPLVRITEGGLNGLEVKPNWFGLSFSITNGSAKNFRIDEVLFYVTADGRNQTPKSMNLANFTQTDIAGSKFYYTSYCTYPPGYSGSAKICQATASSAQDTGTTGGFLNASPMVFVIGGLPVQQGESPIYSVKMRLMGVFLDGSGNDEARFDKSVFFTTQ